MQIKVGGGMAHVRARIPFPERRFGKPRVYERVSYYLAGAGAVSIEIMFSVNEPWS